MKKKERGKVGAVMNSWGKYGIIRETDMWNKRPEFTAWLLEVKLVNLEYLANWEEKQMFKHLEIGIDGPGCVKCLDGILYYSTTTTTTTKPFPTKWGMKASNSTCYCNTQTIMECILMLHALPSLPSTVVILGRCQQRRVLFTAHHYSMQHSSVAVLDRISDICTLKAVGTTWHPCNNKQDVKSDKGKDKSGASDDNSHGRLLSALNSSGGYECAILTVNVILKPI
ncbi:unnamed protein product [Malus baccata var. baccata]